MKINKHLIACAVMLACSAAMADDGRTGIRNAFVLPLPPTPPSSAPAKGPMALPPGAPQDVTPAALSENKSIFDTMAVVGSKGLFVRLRWVQSGGSGGAGSTAGVTYRSWEGKSGDMLVVGGRRFLVKSDSVSKEVRISSAADPKDILWMASMDSGPVYYAQPLLTEYQYVPPLQAAGATSVAGAGAAAQSGGAPAPMPMGAPH